MDNSGNQDKLLTKFKKIINMSQEVSQDQIAQYLGLSTQELFANLIEWNQYIPFKIKDRLIIVEDINNFMLALDLKHNRWNNSQFITFEPIEDENLTTFAELFGITQEKLEETSQTKNIEIPHISESKEEIIKEKNLIFSNQRQISESIEDYLDDNANNFLASLEDKFSDYKINETETSIIDLEGERIVDLPKSIFTDYINVSELYLSDNRITNLPRKIGDLEDLNILDLENNQIASLPKEIQNLKSLTELNLNGNGFCYLAPWIDRLVELKYLHLEKNKLDELPSSLRNLKKLKELHLSYNYLGQDLESSPIIKDLKERGCWVKCDMQLSKVNSELELNKKMILKILDKKLWQNFSEISVKLAINNFESAKILQTHLDALISKGIADQMIKNGVSVYKRT